MVESPHRGTTTYTELKGHLSRCDEKRRGEGKPELLPRGTVDLFLEGLGYMSNWLIEVDKRIGATTGIEGTTSIVWQLNQNRPGDGYSKITTSSPTPTRLKRSTRHRRSRESWPHGGIADMIGDRLTPDARLAVAILVALAVPMVIIAVLTVVWT